MDSRSSKSFIDEGFAKANFLPIRADRHQITLASTLSHISTFGLITVQVRVGQETYPGFCLHVLPKLCNSVILGHNFMSLHQNFQINFEGNRPPLTICHLPALSIEPLRLFTNLKEFTSPIATRSRSFPPTIQKFIDQKIKQLLADEIIEKSNSPWRAQVLVTSSPQHKRRLVVDYSATINRFTKLGAFPLPNIQERVKKVAQFRVFSQIDLCKISLTPSGSA